jgi:hypothetical protein
MGSLLQREWRRDDGAVMRIGRCLIDANCGASTDRSQTVLPAEHAFGGVDAEPRSVRRGIKHAVR